MADTGEGLELAPLRAKVVLDLSEFNSAIDELKDKTEELGDSTIPIKAEIDTDDINTDALEAVQEEAEQTANSFFEIIDEIEQADEEILELGSNFDTVQDTIQQVIEYTDVMTDQIQEAKQAVEGMSHDFIINFNGQQISAMAEDMEELANASAIYEDALARMTVGQDNFDESLQLEFSTLEEYDQEIQQSADALRDMMEQAQGLNVDLSQANEALNDNIPLWHELTQAQQEAMQKVGEDEYNLQALNARFLNISNAIGNLGDDIEEAEAKQARYNETVQKSTVDVSQYNQEAMEFIETYMQQAEATNESTKANNKNKQSLTASQQAMNDYKEALINTYEAFGQAGVKVKRLQTLYKDLTQTQKQGVNEFKNDTQAIKANLDRVVESYKKLSKSGKLDAETNQQVQESIDRLVETSNTLQASLMADQQAFEKTQITAQETGRSFNSVSNEAETAGSNVNSTSGKIRAYGESWWTSATMAMMSIQMITSSMGQLLQDGSEVELSGVGLAHTFGTVGAQAIENFTKNANDANLTLKDVLPTAETLGLALRQYGGTKTEIAGVTTQIMNMANQLQLATGGAVSFSEGADAIRQELAGQSYALKSLGINLSTTLLNQTALNSKWHEAYSKMSSYQQAVIKVDALQSVLNKTFGKTSDYLNTQAGQYQKNITTFKNDAAKLGEALLPLANAILPEILKVVNKIVAVVNKIKSNKWLENKIEWWAKVGTTIALVAVTITGITKSITLMIETWERLKMVTGIITDVVAGLNPLSLALMAIITVVLLVYEAWHHNWLNIRSITKDVIDDIGSFFETFGSDAEEIWSHISTSISAIWNDYFVPISQNTSDVINAIEDFFKNFSSDSVNIFTHIGSSILNIFDYYVLQLPERAEDICNDVINAFGGLLSNVEDIFGDIGSSIEQGLSDAGSAISHLTGGLFMAMPTSLIQPTGLTNVPTFSTSTTNITNNNFGAEPTPMQEMPVAQAPTIGELHLHSPEPLDALGTYNQLQQWSINMANGIY